MYLIRDHTRAFALTGRRLAAWMLSRPRPEDQNESYIISLLTWQRTQRAWIRKNYLWTNCRQIIAVYWHNHREHLNVLCVFSFKPGLPDIKGNYGTCIRYHPARREVCKLIFCFLLTSCKTGVVKTYQWLMRLYITDTSHTAHSFVEQRTNTPSLQPTTIRTDIRIYDTVYDIYSKTCLNRTPYIPETWPNGK
jgi:hypothetical protein